MLKFYSVDCKVYNNGTFIDKSYGGRILAEEDSVQDEIILINWDNLSEEYHKLSAMLPFNFWNFKKGRLVSFFCGNPFKKDFRNIKEWKTKLDIMIAVKYTDITNSISIDEVLKWHDAEKAIQFLNERNLKIK